MRSRLIYAFFGLFLIAIVAAGYAISLKFRYEKERDTGSADILFSVEHEVADWTFGMLLTSIFGIGISALGLFWVRETLVATRVTAEATIAANELARDAVQTAERSWISSEIIIGGKLQEKKDGNWSVELFIRNTNTGKTPAHNVSTTIECSTMSNIDRTIKKLRDSVDPDDTSNGIIIFPGSYFDRPWSFDTDDPSFPPGRNEGICDFIVGCVSYNTVFDKKLHQTVFVYNITPRESGFPNNRDDSIAQKHGDFYLWPWAGSAAN